MTIRCILLLCAVVLNSAAFSWSIDFDQGFDLKAVIENIEAGDSAGVKARCVDASRITNARTGLFSPTSLESEKAKVPDPSAEPPEIQSAARIAKRLLKWLLAYDHDPAAAEKAFLKELAKAYSSGLLEAGLTILISDPRVNEHLPERIRQQPAYYAKDLTKRIGAELESGGLVPGVPASEAWKPLGQRWMKMVRSGRFPLPRRAGELSLLEEPEFIREMETLIGVPFTDGNAVRPLSRGPDAYEARKRLIREARKSVHLMAWAIYDDVSGNKITDLLIEKHRAGLDVKVLVDGQTSEIAHHGPEVLARLEAAGVPLIRFYHPDRRLDGMHGKLMVVDGRKAIAGGRNIGDYYLHAGSFGPKWRDIDVLFEGPAVAEGARTIARIWNEQVRVHGLSYDLMDENFSGEPASGGARIALASQSPEGKAKVMLGLLKAIHGATRRINIENCYFITFPPLREALLDALRRGVEVNIFTNSPESVDEPIVSVPILESLPELIEAGANVYLMAGKDTLHSKSLTVDGIFASVGSFNLNPRSIRYDSEVSVNVLSREFVGELDLDFATAIARARHIRRPEELDLHPSPLNRIVRRYFFNQL